MESGEGGAGPAALHNAYRTGAPEKEQAVAGLLRRGARSEGRHRKAGQFEVSWCEIPTRVGSQSFRTQCGSRNFSSIAKQITQVSYNYPSCPPNISIFVFSVPSGTIATSDD